MNKKFILNLALGSLFVISSGSAFADGPVCISGKPSSTNLIEQLQKAKSEKELTKLIYQKYELTPKTEAIDPSCPSGECKSSALSISAISETRDTLFPSPKAPKLAFNEICLQTSSVFKASTPQVSCPTGTASSSTDMCVTADQLKYQNAVISNFARCAITEGMPGIDFNAIFQKYSLESGFKPQYSSGNGVGIGQLTSIFVDDVHQPHRGLKYMKKIAENKSGECDAAKLIAEKDVNNKPSFSNKCNYTSIGEGFERNILYSMIGIATVWELNIEPKLRSYLKKNEGKDGIDDVKQLTLMNAYGRGGPAAATAAIRRLSSFSPTEFAKRMKKPLYAGRNKDKKETKRNLTEYTSNIDKRQSKIAERLPADLKSEFAKNGAKACINQF